ncbi:four helix bundle protein [Candidatus Gottesmanbacteria bacterium]|nr:four helix bundle protein [Candidatus Gottesmanbacteria bacterium]
MSGGYKSLLVYRCAVTIDDFTEIFCSRFLSDPKYKRTVEQMTQAKRSGKQNIAEGSKELSAASDLLLGSVSRSSYTELAEDYEDFLRHRGLPIWVKTDPRVLRIRAFRESVEIPTNLSNLTNWTNLDFNNGENFANAMVTLCFKQGLSYGSISPIKGKAIRGGWWLSRETLSEKSRVQKTPNLTNETN